MLNYPLDYHSRQARSPSTLLGTLDLNKKTHCGSFYFLSRWFTTSEFCEAERVEWRWAELNRRAINFVARVYKA